jgi:hypothetical protein
VLVGGPDVREVIRAVKSTRAAEPDLDAHAVVALVETNTGIPTRLIDVAVTSRATQKRSTRGSRKPKRARPQRSLRGSGSKNYSRGDGGAAA